MEKELYLEKINNQMLEGLPYDTGEDCTGGEGEEIRCRAGKCSFWVTWDGKFLPCGMLPSNSAKDVFEIGFDEAWKQASEMSCVNPTARKMFRLQTERPVQVLCRHGLYRKR